MLFLRRVQLWIIDFRSETAELAFPEKFAASGGACGGLTTACGSNLNPAEQRVATMLRDLQGALLRRLRVLSTIWWVIYS